MQAAAESINTAFSQATGKGIKTGLHLYLPLPGCAHNIVTIVNIVACDYLLDKPNNPP